ncbi:uncharacterized protein BO80DRAFT_505381 [Aspergillus ibericus CBS 121593]|uniref:Uncharacterized protein n=1 Tax=Aspergillus ibericus CBS 121593 TaxID=1448316 RepID=A0A395GLT1_9EURO|nr:hypothetical protein BO80DRAFT_505381 [Aspergillus ibericus CBS 121593]RAK96470.1 hypothetical protein BO80DRAFT_505381 [Aspergillus ibericus CBS 121593]
MHLDHKIPWNTAASHLNLIKCNPRFTPRRTDFFSRNKPTESTDLAHFRRTLIRTIREFSTTEACKPLVSVPLDSLLSKNLLSYPERHFGLGLHQTNSALHNPLSPKHRSIQSWIDSASTSDSTYPPSYSSGDGDLADAVKMLIIIAGSAQKNDAMSKRMSQEAISVLLALSRHPQVPLPTLANIHWGHAFGVELVADSALTIYILINLMDAVVSEKRAKGNGNDVSLLETRTFVYWAGSSLADYDYPAQNVPHRGFWNGLGVTDSWASRLRCQEGVLLPVKDMGVVDPLKGGNSEVRADLKEYLKTCFAILYIYDMLLREWFGEEEADAKWEYWIGCLFESWGCTL